MRVPISLMDMTVGTSPRLRTAIPALLSVAFILALYLPLLLSWEQAHVVIHDNLDSEVTYLNVLHRAGLAYSTDPEARIDQVMNGIPRSLYRSGYNLTVLLFDRLPPHGAYLIGNLLAHLVALFAMFHLLVRHVLPDREQRTLAWCVAVCFAVIPFYSIYGLTFAAQPLLLSAFLSLRKGGAQWSDVAIIVLFPFTVLNYMVTPFAIAVFGMIGLWDLFKGRSFQRSYWLMLVVLGVTMIAVEWGLLRAMFSGQALVSHRREWDLTSFGDAGASAALTRTISLFLHGHYHSGLFFSVPILLAAAVALFVGERSRASFTIVGLILCILVFMSMLPLYRTLIVYAGDAIPLLKFFTANRFFFLTPVMWALVMAFAFRTISSRSWGVWVVGGLTVAHLYFTIRNDKEITSDLSAMLGHPPVEPSFSAYYAPSLFERIKERTNAPLEDLRFVSLGLPPNIAQFNGLFTLDSYQNNYELAYKHEFRKVIAEELSKSPVLLSYFDDWGSRCYLWSAELGKRYDYYKDTDVTVHNTSYDLDALRAMGGTHILSAVNIAGPLADQLTLLDVFEDDQSAWRIRLYAVDR